MADFPWTVEQAAALLASNDTLLSANAGSGKTSTVVGKILWLLGLEVGVNEETGEPLPRCDDPCELREIAAITFTEKAAHDLKRKLRKEIEKSERAEELRWEIDRAAVGTIHSFCASLLREHSLRLGIDPTFGILDEREARSAQDDLIREVVLEHLEAEDEAVAELFQQFKLDGTEFTAGTVGLVRTVVRDLRWHEDLYLEWCHAGEAAFDLEILQRLFPDELDGSDKLVLRQCDALYRLARASLDRWWDHLREENVRDYDALILDTRDLLTGESAEAALRSIRDRYRILIIDEFQDTDRAQAEIAFAIGRGVSRPQLYFVGDPKQSIYRFRGADITVWNDVTRELEGDGDRFQLTRNFRSQPELIDYLNAVGETAIEEAGAAIEEDLPESRVRYSPLRPALKPSGTAGVEFLEVGPGNAQTRRTAEGEQVARRIREMVEGEEQVVDPETGERRPCRFRDIAVLYRTRTGLEHYQQMLALHGVPVFSAAQGGLADQQEIADIVNALRLVDNPADDLAAFSFLRSPFVGLRDEVIARIALDRGRRSLLYQAREYAEKGGEWWEAPEDLGVAEIERQSLRDSIALVDELTALAARLPLDELVAHFLDRSGYRLHLLAMAENREALANVQIFVRIAEQHRKQPLGTFLDIWSAWDDQDSGLPQAPLYSADDDVVTVTTIHRAKGLEWPVVFLIDTASKPQDTSSGDYWIDPAHGPILGPKQADRRTRALAIVARRHLEERAEEARLLYVATTRARDRLIIPGPEPKPETHQAWLLAGEGEGVVDDRSAAAELDPPPLGPGVELAWLDRIQESPLPGLGAPIDAAPHRWLTSATELMMRENDPDQWELRYVHGVEPVWIFAPGGSGGGVPARIRGDIIHGVLEQIREEEELSRILNEVIGEVDAPELEPYFAAGHEYRQAPEDEICRVVSSDEWRRYTEGEHYRELQFLHLTAVRSYRVGAFDLYRPGSPESLIVDFKTHEVTATQAAAAAVPYRLQVEVYRAAAGVRSPANVHLHFTLPNEVVDMAEAVEHSSR